MSSSRNRTVDLFSLVLGALTVFLTIAIATYDPADRVIEPVFPLDRLYHPNPTVYPLAENTLNWCGPLGALSADMLLTAIGWGAYYLLAALGVLTAHAVLQRPIKGPFIRVFGWFTSLIGLTSLMSTVSPGIWRVPVIGPGGYLGALVHGILSEQVATFGSILISLCAMAIGLLLCTDYFLFQVAAFAARMAISRTRLRPAAPAPAKSSSKAAATEGDLSVRIGGKRIKPSAASEVVEWPIADEEEADEELEEEEYEEEEEADEEYEEDEYEEESEEEEEVEEQPATAPVAAAASAAAKGLRQLIQKASPSLRAKKPPEAEPAPLTVKPGKSPKPDERQEVIAQLEEASRHEETREYDLPSIELLQESEDFSTDEQEKEVRRKAKILEKTFQDFGFRVKVVEIETGPVIAQYEIELEAGLRLSKITGLADDLAIALRVPSVRIVAPIPGKNTVGIEVPNEQRQVVRLREVMEEVNGRLKKMRIPLFLGKDVSGNSLAVDLSSLPHLLIAGRTGTGKSVCLNAIICSILMTRRPDEVRMLMIDPKMVELSGYKTLPHLMHPVVTDMRKAEAILAWAVDKMEERYSLLAQVGVRHISGYNQLGEEELIERLQPQSEQERAAIPVHLPYIVIVADEMADLMMTAGKEVEQHIIRLAQKSRAVGIHLILATQKPTVDVITGLIKSNLPARIAFQVASRTDSRVVLDEMGADKLLGNGDMLFLWPGTSTLLRGQGTFLSDDEINAIVECVSTGEQNFVHELVHMKTEEPADAVPGQLKKRDELYESAVDIVVREGRGSVSLLQRCLGIGYGRAARLIDYMAEDGIVGTYNGSQAREVIISLDDWHRMQGTSGTETTSVPAVPTPPPSPPSPPPSLPAPTSTTSTTGGSPAAASRRASRIISMSDWQPDEDSSDEEVPVVPASTKKKSTTTASKSTPIKPASKTARQPVIVEPEDEEEYEEELEEEEVTDEEEDEIEHEEEEYEDEDEYEEYEEDEEEYEDEEAEYDEEEIETDEDAEEEYEYEEEEEQAEVEAYEEEDEEPQIEEYKGRRDKGKGGRRAERA